MTAPSRPPQQSLKERFKSKRQKAIPEAPDPSIGAYPGAAEVPADCPGDRVGCAWNSPYLLMPQLACKQRCQFGDAEPGSKAWYRRLTALAKDASSPLYLLGAAGGQPARLAFVQRGLLLRDDLVGSVMRLDRGKDADGHLPKGARRDARIGERGGLSVRWDASDEGLAAFYSIYVHSCDRLGVRALGETFLQHERARAPEAFGVALAELDGRVVGGKVVLLADGLCRIVEGSSVRDAATTPLMPDVFLTREVVRYALERGARFVDFGISEGVAEGLRAFKSRMGFAEDPRVVSVEPLPPLSAVREDVALMEACNFGCGFCYRDPWVPDLATEQARELIDRVARLKHSGIALSGGEPTLREDLPELIAYARSRGIRDIQLHTNGWKLVEPGYAEDLEAAGLSSAMVSLHAHTPEVFAKVTATVPENFERTLSAIDRLAEVGIPTILSHVVNSYNYEGLSDWVRFIHQRFPGIEVFFFFVYPSFKGRKHPDMYPRLSDVAPYWYPALALCRDLGVHVNVDNLAGFPPCFMRGYEDLSKYALAEELQARFAGEADDHLVKSSEMRHAKGCAGCRWERVCPGFWNEYMARYGEDEFQAV